jgi:thiol:disulfide interchange protein
MKKTLFVCLALAMFGLFTGCDSGTSQSTDTTGNQSGSSESGKSNNPMHDNSSAPK